MKLMMSILACAVIGLPAAAVAQTGGATVTDQAEKLLASGKRSEALALYRQAVKQDPASFDAQIGIGRLLDLEGQYAEARQHLQKAIEIAPDEDRNAALSTMAQSYAFEGNAAEAAKYYQRVFDSQIKAGALDGAAGTANALGRVYLETGDVTNAEKWYRTGYETSGKLEKRTPADTDLWEMRWLHAQARIAARRKQFDVARGHMTEVQTIIGRGKLQENQRVQYPYLAGYVAFYEGKLGRGDRVSCRRRARTIRSSSACWHRPTSRRRTRESARAVGADRRDVGSQPADGVRPPAGAAPPAVGSDLYFPSFHLRKSFL